MKLFYKNIVFILFCAIFLILSLRGINGNPNASELASGIWSEEGPFELSPERGRFALLYSLVEDRSVFFSLDVARFALPDLGLKNGKYVSLFAPGVSIITIPGYLLGKIFGVAQVGTFFVISVFAILNALLVKKIALRFSTSEQTSTLAAFAFLFASPAYAYAVNLYQHHISTFLILTSVYLLLKREHILNDILVWFLFGIGILVDYPNIFLMLPLMIFMLSRYVKHYSDILGHKLQISIWKAVAVLGIIIPIIIFARYNEKAYGSAFTLAGTVEHIREINVHALPDRFGNLGKEEVVEPSSYEIRNPYEFFKTRNLLNGIYIHLISPDRGILNFAPLILFSIVGIFELTRKKKTAALLVAIAGTNLMIYSMWGDPWGGWAFGSRYLIPAYAAISVFLAVALEKFRRDKLFLLMVFMAFVYSFLINTLGALTSSANPPKIETGNLSLLSGHEEKYTYERNLDYLVSKGTKSYFYNRYLGDLLTPVQYFFLLTSVLMSVTAATLVQIYTFKQENEVELVLKTQGSWKNIRIAFSLADKFRTTAKNMGLF